MNKRVNLYDHYPSLDSFQFSWSLFNFSQLDALSAACPSAFTAALRCLPAMPRELNVVYTDCAGKPGQPTSTGNSQICNPRSLHKVCRSFSFLVESWSYVLVALQSSICSACCSLYPFCPRMAFQRCPCASILSLIVQQFGSLTTFCRFLSLFRLDVSVGLWSP